MNDPVIDETMQKWHELDAAGVYGPHLEKEAAAAIHQYHRSAVADDSEVTPRLEGAAEDPSEVGRGDRRVGQNRA